MHGIAPRTIFGEDWWKTERAAAYARTNQCCAACGVSREDARFHQWMEAHECYDIDWKKGRMVFRETVGLCHCCHNYIHQGRMQALVDKGELTRFKQGVILNHGNLIVKKAALETIKPIPKKIAPWNKWRLMIDGREYPGKFKSYKEWEENYVHP